MASERSKTLFIEDCEHDISYQGDRITEYLDPNHSYKATQITVDAYDQACDVCGRAEQAQFRVTFVNLTRGVTLHMGRICLKKYFGVSDAQLRQSTFLLARLARTWEHYCYTVGRKHTAFTTTREAAQHMHQAFRRTTEQEQLFKPAAEKLKRILDDLAHINSYKTDVFTLINLLGLLHEQQSYPNILKDRKVATATHPLLKQEEQDNAHFVLGWQDVTWSRLRQLGTDLDRIRKKPLPIRIKQVPVYHYPDKETYQQALHEHALQRLTELGEQDKPYSADLFQDVVRQALDKLKKAKSGFVELVFESYSDRVVDRLNLWRTIDVTVKSIGATCLRSDPTSYLEYPKRREFASADAMFRADQQENEDEDVTEAITEPEPRTVYYRSFVFYVPDHYSKAYEVWARHGGDEVGRGQFEDLMSEFPS